MKYRKYRLFSKSINIRIIYYLICTLVIALYIAVFKFFGYLDDNNWQLYCDSFVDISFAIASLIVPIIAISISLQNEDIYGVKISDIYKLRQQNRFRLNEVFLIPPTILIVCRILILYQHYILTVFLSILLVIFIFILIITEVPLMLKQDKEIINILKASLYECYLTKATLPSALKKSLQYLIYSFNFKKVYQLFFKEDLDYQNYLIQQLLELQSVLSASIGKNYGTSEQFQIIDSLSRNVVDILENNLGIDEKQMANISKLNIHLINVFLNLDEYEYGEKVVSTRLRGIVQYLTVHKDNSYLAADFLISFAVNQLKKGNFHAYKTFLNVLSNSSYCLRKNCQANTVFMVLSLYLFYLFQDEKFVPDDLKQDILKFVNQDTVVETYRVTYPW